MPPQLLVEAEELNESMTVSALKERLALPSTSADMDIFTKALGAAAAAGPTEPPPAAAAIAAAPPPAPPPAQPPAQPFPPPLQLSAITEHRAPAP